MSTIGTVRAAVAAALTTVAGVTGYPYPPTTWKPGDGWPQWGGAAPPGEGPYAHSFVHTYRVLIVLPSDPQTADEFVSARLGALVDALAPILAVTDIGPAVIPAGGSQASYNALLITGETE